MKWKRAAVALFIFLLAGCGQINTYTQDFFAMNTFMRISVYGENNTLSDLEREMEQRINQLDSALSRTQENSDIYRLNHAQGKVVRVGEDTYTAIQNAVAFAELTDGAFDPTTAQLVDLWGIGTDNAQVPPQAALDEALRHMGYKNITLLGNNKVQLENGAQIDLGGIGKGFATDQVALLIPSDTSVLAELGGNIGAFGENPSHKDGLWKIGIADPDNSTEYLLTVAIQNESVVTSGDYERYFEQDGVRYHHIFDPKTGYPAKSGLRSVTVVDENSTKADAFSTALFVMGLEKGLAFCEEQNITAVFITEDKRIVPSAMAKESGRFTFTGEGYQYEG